MYYGGVQADKMARPFRRHYSEDGSMEITEDITTGKTSFVFYMGGNAYTAPAIWKHEQTTGGTTAGLFYLHRDYQGSILMITDISGTIKEKRQFDAWGNIVKLTDGNGTNLTAFVILDRGYTGHEHLLKVGLINMNGRLYDPLLHRFLGPDNFVQDPTNSQNFNRYGYVMNNPLKYTDPSGEFAWLAAAIFGGIWNWMTNSGELSWRGLATFAVGAGAGVLGAGASSGVASLLGGASSLGTGFATGAVLGSAGGLAGEFGASFGNALLQGDRLGSALKTGLRGASAGALTGGIVGGIVGGLRAVSKKLNFWTGEGRETYVVPSVEDTNSPGGAGNPVGERVPYSNSSAEFFALTHEELSRLRSGVGSLYADGTIPSGFGTDGLGHFTTPDFPGGLVYGVTDYSGVFKKTATVWLAQAAFVSREQLYLVMHHEFMHAWFMQSKYNFSDVKQHEVIRGWERTQVQHWAPYNITFDRIGLFQRDYFQYKMSNSYLKYGFKVINRLP